jgi:hypothetical protein
MAPSIWLIGGYPFTATPRTSPGWPAELQLRPERLAESPMPSGPPGLYVYQDDVLKP